MKRKTNIHLWPYIGPAVMNELEKSCVVCKSFMLEERFSAYYFVLKSTFEMTPKSVVCKPFIFKERSFAYYFVLKSIF